MKFRKATLKDAKGIAKVLKESYNIKDLKEGLEVFKFEREKHHHYIVAVDTRTESGTNSIGKGKIVGLVTWLIHGLPKHQLAELDRIAVLPEYMGKGVAKGLFDELIKEAVAFYKKKKSKLRKLYLLTHEDNKRAHKFYEKLGFEHEVTLKEHYYKDKHEYVFSRFF